MPQAEQALSGATLERLLSRTTRTEAGCLEWTGAHHERGYGRVAINGHLLYAHRVTYQLQHGVSLTRTQHVCHSCDNPPCINPEHLWLGDGRSNQQDCAAKGRTGTAKLTLDQVKSIRARYWVWPAGRATRSNERDLAAEFGVTAMTIRRVAKRETWVKA